MAAERDVNNKRNKSAEDKVVVIVESPAKTKTIKGYLGKNFEIVSSMGHVRDLPKKELGVAIEENFSPTYVVIPEKRTTLRLLEAAVADAETVYLATDPDREGEAIAWHVAEALKLKSPQRIEFNEITRAAVTKALREPRVIDMQRVNAQQARRILDRLVGYRLSPLLWKKVTRRLSAGRVQSVAVRLICEREREIQAFKSEEYWSIRARLAPDDMACDTAEAQDSFLAKLERVNGDKAKIANEEEINAILSELKDASYVVASVKQQEKRRFPVPPFITSTLQQECVKKLGFSSKKTMLLAQQLYEGIDMGSEGTIGLITYMRTDATRVAEAAQTAAQDFIVQRYGKEYLPDSPPQYRSRKGAQEAHEAIRPTSVLRDPESVRAFLSADQAKLYELIWMRFVASQMLPAILDTVVVDISAGKYTFRATGAAIKFPGFLVVYQEARDEDRPEEDEEDTEKALPPLHEGQPLSLLELLPKQHFTQPPPRYSEATLVKALEENGIGRPSTYAPIISTIQERNYVTLENRRFVPTELGFLVNDRLVQHFADVIDVGFTAQMESELDDIEEGKRDWVAVLNDFWQPFAADLEKAARDMEKVGGQETDETCPSCGRPMVVRYSRLGFFLGCSGFPECKTIEPIEPPADAEATRVGGEDMTEQDEQRQPLCPECGAAMVLRHSRRGPFYGCSQYPKCRGTLPVDETATDGGSATNATTAKEPQPTDEVCSKCGAPMVMREGRYGKFLGCSAYPKCRNIVNIEAPPEPLAKCPSPGCSGNIVQRRFRKGGRGGVFYGCTCYPECDFSLWDRPTGDPCPQCGSLMVAKMQKGSQKRAVSCSNKDCERSA